ncbi:hypothetical protein ACFWEH_33335, partial [Streptomyces anulatus]
DAVGAAGAPCGAEAAGWAGAAGRVGGTCWGDGVDTPGAPSGAADWRACPAGAVGLTDGACWAGAAAPCGATAWRAC